MSIEKYWWLFFIIFITCVGVDLNRCHVSWLMYVYIFSFIPSLIIGILLDSLFVKSNNKDTYEISYPGFIVTSSIMGLFGFFPSFTMIFYTIAILIGKGDAIKRKSKKLGE